LYDLFIANTGTVSGKFWRGTGGEFWDAKLDDSQRDGIASFTGYHCPSRRGSPPTVPSVGGISGAENGPLTDYAAVIHFQHPGGSPGGGFSTSWYRYYRTGLGSDQGDNTDGSIGYNGPMRVANIELLSAANTGVSSEKNVAKTWKPRDTFAYWSDGTSNQLVVGEKHIPKRNIGHCGADKKTPYDCNYYSVRTDDGEGGNRTFAVARPLQSANSTRADGAGFRPIPIAPDPAYYNDWKKPDGTTTSDSIIRLFAFGSSHSGVCNFVLGDGSVRGVSATTSVDVLANLAAVNDGGTTSL
jgi:hypothetical protein